MRAGGEARVHRALVEIRRRAQRAVQADDHRTQSLVRVDVAEIPAVDPAFLEIPAPVAVPNIDELRDDRSVLPTERIATAVFQKECAVAGAIEFVRVEINVRIAGARENPRVRYVIERDEVASAGAFAVVVIDDK